MKSTQIVGFAIANSLKNNIWALFLHPNHEIEVMTANTSRHAEHRSVKHTKIIEL